MYVMMHADSTSTVIIHSLFPFHIYCHSSSQTKDPENPPDLVISADTIVLLPSETTDNTARILEKPGSKVANMDMLEDQNGKTVKVITGVNVVFPSVHRPGYAVK